MPMTVLEIILKKDESLFFVYSPNLVKEMNLLCLKTHVKKVTHFIHILSLNKF